MQSRFQHINKTSTEPGGSKTVTIGYRSTFSATP